MEEISRRDFIRGTAAGLPGLLTVQNRQRRRVVVVGAGLAGLTAALVLHEAGHDVTVLEAQTRPGGRVFTLREPFSDGLYADAGAARIQDSHEYTLRYVKRFGLALDAFFPGEGNAVLCLGRERIVAPQGTPPDLSKLPLEFTAEERAMGLRGGLMKYLFAFAKDVGDPTAPGWPGGDVSHLEVDFTEFVRRQGASSGFIRMLAFGHDLSGMSALQFLRDVALGMQTKQWFKIRGGNDRLPAAFAAALSDRIRYGAPVTRIQQDAASVRVTYRRGNALASETADYAVCTVPSTVVRGIEFSPALSSAKREAFSAVGGLPMARVFLQSRRRFWAERGDTGWATTDDPMDVWDYSRDQPGPRGILGAYLSGVAARTVTGLPPAERGRYILERMERPHPGMREHFERAAAKSWIEDPWARGAGAEFGAGQLSRHYQALRSPEGRIQFGGEHTSPWSGWMNGGIESGHRVAGAILGIS